jgi:Uma2 family endonuclease
VPAIAVEFVSAGSRSRRRDYEAKRDEYLALGVREYWVIDRFRRTMTIFRIVGSAVQEQIVAENDVYRPALLPGFELPLAKVLAAADRWENR